MPFGLVQGIMMAIRIIDYTAVASVPGTDEAIDEIFFSSSDRKQFRDAQERARFRWLWLGQYLEHEPDLALLAVDPSDSIVGYVIGSQIDPARSDRFTELAYFAALRDLTALTPAHLHINVAETQRGRGVGASLIDAQCRLLGALGEPGVHIVTGHGMRNISFYERNGFDQLAVSVLEGRRVYMMRPIANATPGN